MAVKLSNLESFRALKLSILATGSTSWGQLVPEGCGGKGTDRRAAGLPLLYKRALDRLYASHHNTPAGRTGPLVRRLQSYGKLEGLVVGPWGEGSKDLHSLVKVLAETMLPAKAKSLGRQVSEKELGVIVNQIRRYLSTSFIRAQSLCLINRLSYLGRGPGSCRQEGGGQAV